MEESNLFQSQCSFCYENDQQKSFLLRILYRRFKRQLMLIKESQQIKSTKIQGNTFKQLVRIVFPSLLGDSDQCEHLSYANSICHYLQIDKQMFSSLCQNLSNSVGETNYHLSLIAAQIKNVSDSLAGQKIDHQEGKEESSQSCSVPKKKIKKRRGKKDARKKKIKIFIPQQQEQMASNSNNLREEINLIPLVNSEVSISSYSEHNVNHLSYYFTYPVFFHTNSSLQ